MRNYVKDGHKVWNKNKHKEDANGAGLASN